MSLQPLTLRHRAQSTVSLRKSISRRNSQQRGNDIKYSTTMTSFRPKFERMIQQGKIEQIMNQDPSSKAHLYYTNHVSQMEKELSATKKALSTLVIKSRFKQQSINSTKNQIRKIQREIEIIRTQAEVASKRFSITHEQLQAKKNEKDIMQWNEKAFTQMKSLRYKDEVFLKGRYEALQRECNFQTENHRLLQIKYHELKQLNRQLKIYGTQARSIAKSQSIEQREYIELRDADMSQRKLLGELKQGKLKREVEINGIASSLIERQELLRILQVLYSHRMLSQIIKLKSNSLIKRYQEVNKAYNYIRSNSNIVQPEKILRRMEEHDKLYDGAVKRVDSLEAQLGYLQNSLNNCRANRNDILSQEGNNQIIQKSYYQGLQFDKFEILRSKKYKLISSNKNDEVLRKNIQNWGSRMFSRFGIALSESNNFLDCLTDLVVKIRQQK